MSSSTSQSLDDAIAAQRGTDRPLDEDIVRRIIPEQFPAEFPGAGLEGLRKLGSGWDNDAYLVPGRKDRVWVFRFPRRAGVVAQLTRELHWLPLIAATLTDVAAARDEDAIAVPRLALHGMPSAAYPYPFAAYELLEGASVAQLEPDIAPAWLLGIGQQLGPALRGLHGLTEASLPGGPPLANDVGSVDGWFDYATSNRGRLLAALPTALTRRCAAHLDRRIPMAPFAGPPCLLHNDLGSEHVLLADGAMTGIIDFGDLDVGDPAVELANTAMWLGAEGFAALLASYGASTAIRHRASYLAPLIAMAWVIECLDEGPDALEPKHIRWLERAFTASARGLADLS